VTSVAPAAPAPNPPPPSVDSRALFGSAQEIQIDHRGQVYRLRHTSAAATLALMTCWAEPEPTASLGAAQQRMMMARKIVSNLYFLREHPHLPCGLRLVITKLHARWCDIAQALHQRALPTEPASRELH
jgi:hemin uptake protein HemP